MKFRLSLFLFIILGIPLNGQIRLNLVCGSSGEKLIFSTSGSENEIIRLRQSKAEKCLSGEETEIIYPERAGEKACPPGAKNDLYPGQTPVDPEANRPSGEKCGAVSFKPEFDDSHSLEKHLEELLTALHEQGYLEASIDSIVYNRDVATSYLHKGRQYRQVAVSLDRVDEQVLRMLNIRADRYERQALDIDTFRTLQNILLNHYENSGYPFATAALADIKISNDTIGGRLEIEKNFYYRFDSIHIYGDAAVEPKHLYRHIGVHPGDPYSEKKFRAAGELIRQTPFLTEIRKAEMEFMTGSAADLYLYIDSRQASHFSGIIGVMPGGRDKKTRLAGELNLNLLNVFRRMENIHLQWQSPASQVQEMDMEAGLPYLFGQPFGLDLHLHMFKQDSSYFKVEAEAGVPVTMPGRGVIRVFGKTTGTSIIDGNRASALTAPAAEVRGQVLGLSYRHGRIDNVINPYRGWQLKTSLGAGNKRVKPPPGYNSFDERRTGFAEGVSRLQWFVPLTPSSTVMLSNLSGIKLNLGRQREENYFFAGELFLLGGLHSIRGFGERSLAASSYSIQRIEYRYLFNTTGNIFLFFDGMTYKKRLPDAEVSDMPFGFGAGLTLDTRAGQFMLSYAVGREFDNPVSFRSSRVHMGVINRF